MPNLVDIHATVWKCIKNKQTNKQRLFFIYIMSFHVYKKKFVTVSEGIIIVFLDIIYRPVFYIKHNILNTEFCL
jgi:hypothetical protein